MIEQGSTGIFAVPAALADDICKNMPQGSCVLPQPQRSSFRPDINTLLSEPANQQQQQQRQNPLNESLALTTCIRFARSTVNLSRETTSRLPPTVTTHRAARLDREREEQQQKPQRQHRHKGFKLSKMTSVLNFRPPAVVRRAGNALVKSVSTIFLKTAMASSTVTVTRDVPPTPTEPSLNDTDEVNRTTTATTTTCLPCFPSFVNQRRTTGGQRNGRWIGGGEKTEDYFSSSDESYADHDVEDHDGEYEDKEGVEEEEVEGTIDLDLSMSQRAPKSVVFVDVHSLPLC